MEPKLEEKTEQRIDEKQRTAILEKLARRLGEEIDPNKWYGTCYGRDLEAENGINYR